MEKGCRSAAIAGNREAAGKLPPNPCAACFRKRSSACSGRSGFATIRYQPAKRFVSEDYHQCFGDDLSSTAVCEKVRIANSFGFFDLTVREPDASEQPYFTALQITPQALDPLQQTVATVIQGFLNHPEVERKRAISAIGFLNAPMLRIQVTELKTLYKEYQQTRTIMELVTGLEAMRSSYGINAKDTKGTRFSSRPKLAREDLRLICFDVVSND